MADKRVTVRWNRRDHHGRVVGVMFVDGVDVGLEQIKKGMAWHYKKYQAEQRPEDRQRYADAERQARARRVGLWVYVKPIPPWDYLRLPRSP